MDRRSFLINSALLAAGVSVAESAAPSQQESHPMAPPVITSSAGSDGEPFT
jgi:hypothetical protein